MRNYDIIKNVINSDEEFIWNVTGSIADAKYNPMYWFLTLVTCGFFLVFLYYKRIFGKF